MSPANIGSVSGAVVENPITSGVSGTISLGVLDTTIGEGVLVEVTSVDCTAQVYTVSFWSDIPDSVAYDWIPIE